MTDDAHLDGNALAALFHDMFGREMTYERACCDVCGAIGRLGSLMAYMDAPGAVLRCATCGSVLLVAVALPTTLRVSFSSLRWLELSTDPTSVG